MNREEVKSIVREVKIEDAEALKHKPIFSEKQFQVVMVLAVIIIMIGVFVAYKQMLINDSHLKLVYDVALNCS